MRHYGNYETPLKNPKILTICTSYRFLLTTWTMVRLW